MKIILLSGGSGKPLWPLTNEARAKQFLRILPAPDGGRESMLQRVVRQIHTAVPDAAITFTTSAPQRDIIINQLGDGHTIVTEPCRRGTFPAIALAALQLNETHSPTDEVVVVIPCDTYAPDDYFHAIRRMAQHVERGTAPLLLLGIAPTYPTAKYGYIQPAGGNAEGGETPTPVAHFAEKSQVGNPAALIADGGLWNSAVYACRLSYLLSAIRRELPAETYEQLRSNYHQLPQSSFDHVVVAAEPHAAAITYRGPWKDLGTWRTLTNTLTDHAIGNVIADTTTSATHVINQLEMPILCIGAQDMVVAATPDGILVADKKCSDSLPAYADTVTHRPMYEERRWGEYKVIDTITFPDGHCALTKQLVVRAGRHISYQLHRHRSEVWTFISGTGTLVVDGETRAVGRGDVINIPRGVRHAVRATTDLHFIEVQSGDLLVEEDIERFEWEW